MNAEDYIIAVDAGTANITVLAGKQTEDGRVEIVTGIITESKGLMRGDIKNIEESTKAIKAAINDVENELGIEIKDVVVGMSGSSIKCNRQQGYVFIENNDGELGEVKEADLNALSRTIRNAQVGSNEHIIHISAQSYAIDGDKDIKQPIGIMGKNLEGEFNIVPNDKEAVSRMEKCLGRVGVKPAGYVLNSIAAAEAVLTEDEKELGVVVVDIGAGTTDIAVYHDNIVKYVAVIPIGGELINKDICQTGVLKRSAENLKIKGVAMYEKAPNTMLPIPTMGQSAKKAISTRNLSMIIEARLMDIIEATLNELNKSGYAGKLEAGVVLTGGTAHFDHIDELFSKHMNMPVRIASYSPNVAVGENTFYNDLSYMTAMGILVKSCNDGLKTYTKSKPKAVEVVEEQPVQPVQEKHVADEEEEYEEYENEEENEDSDIEETPTKSEKSKDESGNAFFGFLSKIRKKFGDILEVVDDTPDSDDSNNNKSSNYKNL